jgi:hypothetical protein
MRQAAGIASSIALAALGAGAGGGEVVARLFGEPMTRSEVSAPAAFRIYRHEVAIHALLEDEARRLADERTLRREAERRGSTPEALLAEVEAGAAPASDADVARHLAERPSSEPEARQRVRSYLAEKRRIERRLAYLEKLRREAGYAWLLPKPLPPRSVIDVTGAPARGPDLPGVTLVHFASFGSHDSAASAEKLARVAEEFAGRVRLVHRNFPREGDAAGLRGAGLGFAAQEAGRFWELHDALFARAGNGDPDAAAAALAEAGLPASLLARAEEPALLARLRGDLEAGRRAGVLREPTVFVNGRYWSGLGPYAELRALVAEELTP